MRAPANHLRYVHHDGEWLRLVDCADPRAGSIYSVMLRLYTLLKVKISKALRSLYGDTRFYSRYTYLEHERYLFNGGLHEKACEDLFPF
jgi:hypothetical protein